MEDKLDKLYNEFKPESRHFITEAEVFTIQDILGIDESSQNLQEVRNAVVRYCSDNYKPDGNWTQELLDKWDIMSAATGVIDNLKWKRGEEI